MYQIFLLSGKVERSVFQQKVSNSAYLRMSASASINEFNGFSHGFRELHFRHGFG